MEPQSNIDLKYSEIDQIIHSSTPFDFITENQFGFHNTPLSNEKILNPEINKLKIKKLIAPFLAEYGLPLVLIPENIQNINLDTKIIQEIIVKYYGDKTIQYGPQNIQNYLEYYHFVLWYNAKIILETIFRMEKFYLNMAWGILIPKNYFIKKNHPYSNFYNEHFVLFEIVIQYLIDNLNISPKSKSGYYFKHILNPDLSIGFILIFPKEYIIMDLVYFYLPDYFGNNSTFGPEWSKLDLNQFNPEMILVNKYNLPSVKFNKLNYSFNLGINSRNFENHQIRGIIELDKILYPKERDKLKKKIRTIPVKKKLLLENLDKKIKKIKKPTESKSDPEFELMEIAKFLAELKFRN